MTGMRSTTASMNADDDRFLPWVGKHIVVEGGLNCSSLTHPFFTLSRMTERQLIEPDQIWWTATRTPTLVLQVLPTDDVRRVAAVAILEPEHGLRLVNVDDFTFYWSPSVPDGAWPAYGETWEHRTSGQRSTVIEVDSSGVFVNSTDRNSAHGVAIAHREFLMMWKRSVA
jgi:hypothetical protein